MTTKITDESGKSQGRLALIEYLRGLAALGVAWFHLTNTYSDNWVRFTGSQGWLGVEVFFVISGFVIPLSIAGAYKRYSLRQFPQFMAKRVLRLEPPYLASIGLVLILWQLSSMAPGFRGAPPPWSLTQCLAHLLYVVPLTNQDWLQPVYWSLAWEFLFYVSVGVFFPLLGRSGNDWRWYIVVAFTIGLVVREVLPARSLLFVMGYAIYRAGMPGQKLPHKAANLLAVGLSAIVIGQSNISIAIVGGVTAILIYGARTYVAPRGMHAPLMMLGGLSYSLYLTHVPVGGRIVNLGRRFIENPLGEFLLSLTALVCCLLFAKLFFHLIERPSLQIARRAFSSKLDG